MSNYERLTVKEGGWSCQPVICHDINRNVIDCHMVEFRTTFDGIDLSQLLTIDPKTTREVILMLGHMFYRGVIAGAEHYPVFKNSPLNKKTKK